MKDASAHNLDEVALAVVRELAISFSSGSPATSALAGGVSQTMFSETLLPLVTSGGLKMAFSDPRWPKTQIGLDAQGILHIPAVSLRDADDPGLDASAPSDRVVLLADCSGETAALSSKMAGGSSTSRAQVSAQEHYRAVLPEIPLLDLVQRARVRAQIWTPDTAENIQGLHEDAEIAWRYFENFNKRYGGLAPATAWAEPGRTDHYPIVTMWDLGSLVFAAISARRLNLIDDSRLGQIAESVVKILRVAVFVADGARLPATSWSIAGGPGDLVGFDAADTGRLLIAMYALDSFTKGTMNLAALVEDWNLAAAVANGELHDFSHGRWKSMHDRLYTLYAHKGFNLWGFETKPVFEDPAPASNMDRAIGFLEQAARRGPFATEPFTTAEIEFGGSPHARLIADVVYAAQVKRYESSGVLTAVSETPIDEKPWFTYQGYQPTKGGGSWPVHVPSGHGGLQTEDFETRRRTLSSKASFLWAATRTDPYSEALIRTVRGKAVTTIGFASGIYEFNMERTKTADINTNALILESVAYLLNGRTPNVASPNPVRNN